MKNLKVTWYAILITIYAIILISATSSCTQDDPQPTFDLSTFEGVIASGGASEDFDEAVVEVKEQVGANIDSTLAGGDWICKREKVTIGKGNSKFPTFNPNANVIYPGSLLQGNSLENGTPAVINVERAGGIISHDINAGGIDPIAEVTQITKSGVQAAISKLIGEASDVKIPSNFTFDYFSVQSQQQMAFKLGLSVKTMVSKFDGRMSFNKSREFNQYIIKLTQQFYTLSWDLPTGYDKIFAPEVTPQDLVKYTGPGNPATYISDVTYGRIYYMLIESTNTSQEMEASINGSFKGLVQVSGSAEASSMSKLSNLKIQVIALGGDADATFNTIGETDISVIVDELGKAGDINTGKPLSYVVRNMFDDKIVGVKLATEYDIVTCEPAGPGNLDFLPRQVLNTTLMTPYIIQSGDMNNDGAMDLVLNHSEGETNEIQIAYSKNDGTFELSDIINHPTFPEGIGWTSFNLQTADFNNDGHSDLVWTSVSTNKNYIYYAISNGDGTFDFGEEFLSTINGWGSYSVHIGDFDGDGNDDISWNSTITDTNRTWFMFSKGGKPDLNLTKHDLPFTGWANYLPFIGNFNGDLRDDYLFRRYSGNSAIHVAISDGTGKLNTTGAEIGSGWSSYKWTLTGDIDGDGADDVAIPSENGAINAFLSNGNNFIVNDRITSNMGSKSSATTNTYLVDMNADGKMDFLWNVLDANGNSSGIGLAVGNGKFNFGTVTQYHPDFEENWLQFGNTLYPGDINGDEKADLIWAEPTRDMKIYVGLAK